MKLILAIVSGNDNATVQVALTKKHFPITKLATTGGFLEAGNTTFIVGVEGDKVEEIISEIATHSNRRAQTVSSASAMDMGLYASFPVEVTIGGLTISVTNVGRYEKV